MKTTEKTMKTTENAKKKIDLDRAIEAYRCACPFSYRTRHMDECFAPDGEERNYKCKDNICPRLRKFINILKEPEQD